MSDTNVIATFSGLGKFANCRRSWWLSEYRRLRPIQEPRTGALPFGSRIHAALEAFYDGTIDSPVTAWKALIEHEYAVAAETGAFTDGLDKESRLGQVMLEGYLEWTEQEGIDADWEVLSVEHKASDLLPVTLPTGEIFDVIVRGKFDRRMRRISDGAVFIDDFKTIGNFGEPALAGLLRSPQPRIYLMLERAHAPEGQRSAGAVFTLLRKVLRTASSKPPYFMRLPMLISEQDLAAYTTRMRGQIEDLVSVSTALDMGADPNTVAYFQPSWQCATCPFRQPCELMQSTSQEAGEQMLRDLFVEHDPWSRYREGDTPDPEAG